MSDTKTDQRTDMDLDPDQGSEVPTIDATGVVERVAHELERVQKPPDLALVVFGASGDLAARKLMPALASLCEHNALPDHFTLIGVARTSWSDVEFRNHVLESTSENNCEEWPRLVSDFHYVAGEYGAPETFEALKQVLTDSDDKLGTAGNRVYYLATIPDMFSTVATALATHGCNVPAKAGQFARLVIEKPFGRDLDSALALDASLHESFKEEQIYRIDHYMGKETVQNVLALRFANAIFEPVWNRRFVDHIQITVAEQLGVEHRGGFYEHAGALRDIVQNHVMQVLALTLMEPPVSIDAQGIRDEKVKLLRAVVVPTLDEAVTTAVRGQYVAGEINGTRVPGYRDEEDVDSHSTTETFVAMKLVVDNWRWAGVPVYVRTGKRLAARATEVALQFQPVPHLAFGNRLSRDLRPDAMVLRIQPDDGITLELGVKVPGEAFRLRTVGMDFSYATAFPGPEADGYERLLHDAMIGDPTLFIRTDEVEAAWRIVDPYLSAWAEGDAPLSFYPAGSWGPRRIGASAQSRAPPVEKPLSFQLVNMNIRVVDDVAVAFASEVAAAFATRPLGSFSLVCSGGPTARVCYEELSRVDRYDLDWSVVDVYMGDERRVPAGDREANQRLVRECLLDRVGKFGRFHPMSCEEGAARYARLVQEAGEFDLVHLGMGPDGHTASLFPNGPELDAGPEELVLLTSDPSGNNRFLRMTLTFAAFSVARKIVFTIEGEDKREAFAAIRAGTDAPAARVTGRDVLWLVDKAAYGE